MLKIDIWTDYVCQFCYIGKRELENAIKKTNMEQLVDINYHAYQLTPEAPTKSGTYFLQFISQHMGAPIEKIEEMIAGTTERAKSLGLDYHFEELMHQSTLKAHRVAKFAKEQGLEKEFNERLFYGVFTENVFLPDTETLVKLAQEVDLDGDKVRAVAEDEQAYLADVEQDFYTASQIGVQGVPYYVFNDQYAVSGAQPEELFVELLEKLKNELNLQPPLQMFGDSEGTCGPDGCIIP